MQRITIGLVLVFTSLSASLQQPAGAVVCTGTGVLSGMIVQLRKPIKSIREYQQIAALDIGFNPR